MPTKRPLIRFRDIVENGQSILEYTHGMDFDAYSVSKITRDASERCLARISEASFKLGSTAEEIFPSHNWGAIRGFGNMLRHEYDDILDETTWAIVTRHLPPLLFELETFLARYPEDQETL
ncbi:Uncharacterized conserved protein, contains HEPN domain [Rhizobium sp. NFR12]|nr:Uncharacterized conserved protein, contains HEPN domain [Rhizobium sp. NFR12]